MKLGFGKILAVRVLIATGLVGVVGGCMTQVPATPSCYQMNGRTTVKLDDELLNKCCDRRPPATNNSALILKPVPNIPTLMLCGNPPANTTLSASPLPPSSQPEPIASPTRTP